MHRSAQRHFRQNAKQNAKEIQGRYALCGKNRARTDFLAIQHIVNISHSSSPLHRSRDGIGQFGDEIDARSLTLFDHNTEGLGRDRARIGHAPKDAKRRQFHSRAFVKRVVCKSPIKERF